MATSRSISGRNGSLALADFAGKPAGQTLDVTFNGAKTVAIPPKAPMLSDPISLDVKALDSLSISMFLPTATGPCTCHFAGTATAFVSAPGNFTAATFEPASAHQPRLPLCG